MTAPVSPPSGRVGEIDALRGIAAVLVMLFHYTTRYDDLYGHTSAPIVSVPWGHLGVNLFFMISGYVIYMTLERTRTVADFVVSRFSRLYPAFWAAVPLTFAVVSLLGLPGKEVAPQQAALNFLMFHGLFGVPHVDGVYWTLEVELLFYAWTLLAFRLGWLHRIHEALALFLAVRFAYFVLARWFNIELSWTLGYLMIIKYIPWFACGIMVYRLTSHHAAPGRDFAILGLAILCLGVVDSPEMAALAGALALLLHGAARGRAFFLRNALLLWLGEISYTIYLLHENIGWALLRQLEARGIGPDAAIALAIAVSLLTATVLTRTVERPAMNWLRARYRQRLRTA